MKPTLEDRKTSSFRIQIINLVLALILTAFISVLGFSFSEWHNRLEKVETKTEKINIIDTKVDMMLQQLNRIEKCCQGK